MRKAGGMGNGLRGLLVAAAAAGGADISPLPPFIPESGSTTLVVRASEGDRVLCVGGFYISEAEGPVEPGLGLRLNGTPLDRARLQGPADITTPLLEKAYGSVYPAFDAASGAFRFKRDADGELNNGPWTRFFRPARYKTNHAFPFIQLDVGDLLKPGDNQLAVTNVNTRRFHPTVLRAAPALERLPDPLLPMPSWIVFSESPAERVRYEAALKQGAWQGAEKAELLAAMGLDDLLTRKDWRGAIAHGSDALAASPVFPSRSELLCRIAAERLENRAWRVKEAEIREALKSADPEDSWTGMARTLLAVKDGEGAEAARPVLALPLATEPMKTDGVLDEPAWKTARPFPLIHVLGTNRTAEGGGEVRFVLTPDRLAVAFSGPLPASAAWVAGTNRDAAVWEDNAVELLLSPDLQYRTYYELNASARGGVFDGRHAWCWKTDPSWNGDWTAAGKIETGGMTVEYGIPWKTIGLDGPPLTNRWLTLTAIRVRVERNGQGKPAAVYLSATPHRQFDTHRLMDGLLLQAADPARPARGTAMADVLARVPPLAHGATGRWPMVTWTPFLEEPDGDYFKKREQLSDAHHTALAERGLVQAIRLSDSQIPLARAIRQAGGKVIVVQGAGGSDAEAPDLWHQLDPDFKSAFRRVNTCPLLLAGWQNHAVKFREQLLRFKAAGVELDGIWMDDESQPWGGTGEWEQSRRCGRCRELFPAGVLDDKAVYRRFIGRFKQSVLEAYLAAPAREVFPKSIVLNWGSVYSTPDQPTPTYWSSNWVPPVAPGLFNGLNPVAYGNDVMYRDYWATAWSDPSNTPLDEAHMDRLYTAVMLGQFSRNAELAERWAPEKLCVPWVCRYCPDLEDPVVPVLSRPRYREILRHLWLRGADAMQIFNPLRPERPGVHLEEIEDAVAVYDEMLAFRDFLDRGSLLNTALPAAADDGAIWSGLKLGDRAVVRAFTQGAVPVRFKVQPWPGGPELELEAPPAGATYVVTAAGGRTRVDAAP